MIEIRHLLTLQAIAEEGTLARAAQRRHVSQSALSHQIRELEDRLGQELLTRSGRRLRFTPAGERLLRLGERVLPELRRAEADLRRMREGRGGRLHLAVECHSCFDWLMPAMEAYRPDWPDVELDVTLAFHFEPLPALARGDLDLVVTSDPCPLPGIAYEALFAFQGVLVMAPDHPLAGRRHIHPADLADQTLITYPVAPERLDVYRHFLIPAGVHPERRTTELTAMIVQLAAAGRGVAALPHWAVQDAEQRGVIVTRPLGAEGIWRTLHLALRSEQADQPYLQAFVDTARHVARDRLSGIRPV